MDQKLPKAIQDELDAAEAIEQQMQQASNPPEEGNTLDPQQPADEPKAEPEQQVVNTETQVENDETWRRKYEILQGKYQAEVPRYAEQIREQKEAQQQQAEQLRALQSKLEDMNRKPAEPEKTLVTKSDEETFGADLVDLTRRVAKDENSILGKRLTAIEDSIGKLTALFGKVEKVEQVQELSVQDKFYETLTARVPDWETINADQKWLAWLRESDPLTGVQRQQILDAAQNSLNGVRVADIFDLFKKQFATAPTKQKSKDDLNRQVAPVKQGGSSNAPQTDKIWSLAEYEAAYDPRLTERVGAKEADALQAEADRALAEGRVR